MAQFCFQISLRQSSLATSQLGPEALISVWDLLSGGKLCDVRADWLDYCSSVEMAYAPTGILLTTSLHPGLSGTRILWLNPATGGTIGRCCLDVSIYGALSFRDPRYVGCKNRRIPLPLGNENQASELNHGLPEVVSNCLSIQGQWIMQGFCKLSSLPPNI